MTIKNYNECYLVPAKDYFHLLRVGRPSLTAELNQLNHRFGSLPASYSSSSTHEEAMDQDDDDDTSGKLPEASGTEASSATAQMASASPASTTTMTPPVNVVTKKLKRRATDESAAPSARIDKAAAKNLKRRATDEPAEPPARVDVINKVVAKNLKKRSARPIVPTPRAAETRVVEPTGSAGTRAKLKRKVDPEADESIIRPNRPRFAPPPQKRRHESSAVSTVEPPRARFAGTKRRHPDDMLDHILRTSLRHDPSKPKRRKQSTENGAPIPPVRNESLFASSPPPPEPPEPPRRYDSLPRTSIAGKKRSFSPGDDELDRILSGSLRRYAPPPAKIAKKATSVKTATTTMSSALKRAHQPPPQYTSILNERRYARTQPPNAKKSRALN